MHERLCEQCGKPGTVTVGSVGPNRDGNRSQPRVAHRYCVDCARAAGVPIPQRNRDASEVTEPVLASWLEVEQYLAQYEQILHEQPDMREQVLSFARSLRTYAGQIPGAMPPAVVQGFARIGADKPA